MSTKKLDGHGTIAAINLGVSKEMEDFVNTGQHKGSTTMAEAGAPHCG